MVTPGCGEIVALSMRGLTPCAGSARGHAEEAEDAKPGVLAGLRMVGHRAVEEAVRRAVVDDRLGGDVGGAQRLGEGDRVVLGDALVGAAVEREHRRLQPPGARLLERRGAALLLPRRPAVHAAA